LYYAGSEKSYFEIDYIHSNPVVSTIMEPDFWKVVIIITTITCIIILLQL